MNKFDLCLTKHFKKIFWITSVVIFILYFALLGGDYIWADESYSMAMIKHSFSDIWKITAADVHPPLYYWYLKIFNTPFGDSLFSARLASILPYMFIIVWGGKQIKELFNERTAILFMVLFFVYPFALDYSIEIRMYSLSAAAVFSCAIFAYKIWLNNNNKRNILGFIISGVFAAYSHYFAFVSIIVIYGILLLCILFSNKKLLPKWGAAVLISILLYLPWMTSFIKQLTDKVENEYWIPPITVSTIGEYINTLLGTRNTVFLAIAFISCFIFLFMTEKKTIIICIFCFLIPFITILLGIVVSIVVRPIFTIRYVAPSAPLLILFLSIIISKQNNKLAFSILTIVTLIPGIIHYGDSIYYQHNVHNFIYLDYYDDIDTYLVIGNPHISSTLCYYTQTVTIYCTMDVSAEACPYPNMNDLLDFDMDNTDKLIMLWDGASSLPDAYSKLYDIYDVTSLGTWVCEMPTEAYLLTKKR